MAKKAKNRQKQNIRKAKKQKIRQERIKKQTLSNRSVSKSKPDVENMVDQALELVEKGNLKEGEKILDKLKKKHGQHSHVYYGFGVIAAFTDKHDEAIQHFTKAIQIFPNFVEAHYNLGIAYQKQFKIPEMINSYRQVVKLPGSDIANHAQDMLNSLEQQIQDSNGISLDDYLGGYKIFEQGFEYMESENWEAAIAKFNDTIKIINDHTQSYGNLGICYASIGKIQQSLNALDKAIELDPSYEPALVNRKIAESLKEGECLKREVRTVNYYKDFVVDQAS